MKLHEMILQTGCLPNKATLENGDTIELHEGKFDDRFFADIISGSVLLFSGRGNTIESAREDCIKEILDYSDR